MVGDYESAIRSGAEDARVDEVEEQLLELMEQAEEELESGE